MSEQVDTLALRALMEGATPGQLRARQSDHGGSVETDDEYELAVAWLGASSSSCARGSRSRSGAQAFADAKYFAALVNAAPALLDEVDALRARVAELQAEVDACGEIIGQPPGASRGHAEIIAATIARHQEHGEQLAARVAELERELERVRERDATAFLTGLRVIRSPWIQRGTIIVNDQEMSDAGFERAALAPRAEVKP